MKLFLDTANLKDIEVALKGGFVRGVTTNPSLLAKEPKGNYIAHIKKIVALIRKYQPGISLSVEVFTNDKAEMIKQAKQFVKEIGYKNVAIKIPINYKGQSNLDVIHTLSKSGVIVNCTACMTPLQLMAAAASGATYVSLFYNRLKDAHQDKKATPHREILHKNKMVEVDDWDPDKVLRETALLLKDYPKSEIIVGSIRTPIDVKRAGLNGGHIVTASLKIIEDSLMHFKTDDSVDRFLKDFETWLK